MSETKEKFLNTLHKKLTVEKIVDKYANKHEQGLEILMRRYQSLSSHIFPCTL
jgi:hypothetical protein